jgi:hypothetical protein
MNLEPKRNVAGFADDLATIRPTFEQGVPSYFALLGHVQTMLVEPGSALLRALDRAWSGRTFHVVYDRPLLFLAALRAEAMREGSSHPLYAAIGTDHPRADGIDAASVRAALAPGRDRFFETIATRWVQTNETLRAVTWRWPAWLAGCEGGRKPLALVDLGASAGLNLVAERLPAVWTEPNGALVSVATSVRTVLRLGLDAQPVDLADPDNVQWMRACIWPGDRGRLDRLESALRAFFDAQREPGAPTLERVEARSFAARLARVADEHQGAFLLAYQSYMRDYLSPADREAHRAAMYAWLATLAPGRAAWIELEAASTDADHPEPAAITAHLCRPEGDVGALEIARSGHHPIQIKLNKEAISELGHALTSWQPALP